MGLINLPMMCFAVTMLDDEIKELIIRESISGFKGECACPYSNKFNKDSNSGDEQLCGGNSEYFKVPGELQCYPTDITAEDVKNYRDTHGLTIPLNRWKREEFH